MGAWLTMLKRSPKSAYLSVLAGGGVATAAGTGDAEAGVDNGGKDVWKDAGTDGWTAAGIGCVAGMLLAPELKSPKASKGAALATG